MPALDVARFAKLLKNATGALVGYISGDGSEVQFVSSGTLANRPAASVYNVGAVYFATDVNGGTGYTNLNGISWTKTHVGVNYETAAQTYLRDTLANVLATTGSYVGQEAYVTNYGTGPGLKLVWLGAAWGLPPWLQRLEYVSTSVTAPTDTNENTLYTYSGSGGLPAIFRANDLIRVQTRWSLTSNANTKTCRIRFGAGSAAYSASFTSVAGENHVADIQFRNSLSAQLDPLGNKDVYGGSSNDFTTGTLDFSAQRALTVSIQKGTAGDAILLLSTDVWVCGS